MKQGSRFHLGSLITSPSVTWCKYAQCLCVVLFASEIATTMAAETEIPIGNHSFEVPVQDDNSFSEGNVPGWTGTGTFGVANPANNHFTGTTDNSAEPNPINGLNAATINEGGKLVYQDAGLVIQSDASYRVTLLAGHRIGVPFGSSSVSFWAGTQLLAEKVPNPPYNTFIAVSLSYTSPPSGDVIGQPLRIELRAEGRDAQAWFDDVRLFEDTGPRICTPRKAKATAQLVNGFVVGATVTDSGCGYTNPPAVLVQGGGGSGALARATVADGVVTEIQILNAGVAYTSLPRIVIGSPPFVPTVAINVSRINVTQNVVLGWKYVLETSTNNLDWTATGPAFVADSESLATEFNADAVGQFFRLKVVP